MRLFAFLFAVVWGLPAMAGSFSADVIILGEVHDNPHHHARQAEVVAQVQPSALVFEMLTADQARAHITNADAATLAAAFEWDAAGWPGFEMYFPIFAAAPDAKVFGAGVPRDRARAVMSGSLVAAFGDDAATFGLSDPLPEAEQMEREAFQMAAHCDALPKEMLPGMVDVQRLRDAELARVALIALAETNGPVVVITGNGHARTDWGMPVYLRRVAPEVTLVTLGQGEDGIAPDGMFDVIEYAPGVERPDPCDAFR